MTLLWRIRPIMVEREIYTVRELHRRLNKHGYPISEVQLGRVRKSLPKLLDTALLDALCHVLEVSPGDLLVRKGDGAYRAPPRAETKATPQPAAIDVPVANTAKVVFPDEFPIAGPKIGAMRVREPNK